MDIADASKLVGLLLLVVAASWISVPLGIATAGVSMLVIGWLIERNT